MREKNEGEPALILSDRSGIGLRLQKELEARGQEVFIFEAEDYDAFIAELAQRDKFPYRVYHLPGIDPVAHSVKPAEQIDDDLARGFYGLLYLVQALGKYQTDPQRQIQLEVVTGSGQEVTGEEDLCPGKAPLYGLCRVIPQEYPTIRCRCSDILPAQPGAWLTALIEDLCAGFGPGEERMVAYRGNYRWVKSFKPRRLEKPEPAAIPLRNGGVYLITGGVGAIGLVLARHLAASYKAQLALTCRSAFPAAAEWGHWLESHPEEDRISKKIRQLLEIEALGGRVMIVSAGVASVEAMRDVVHRVESTFGPINGVIHSAGIVGRQSFTALAIWAKQKRKCISNPKFTDSRYLPEVLQTSSRTFAWLCLRPPPCWAGWGLGHMPPPMRSWILIFSNSINFPVRVGSASIGTAGNWMSGKSQDSPLGAVIKDLAMSPEEGAEVMERVLAGVGLQQVVQCTGDLQLRIDRWKLPNAAQ